MRNVHAREGRLPCGPLWKVVLLAVAAAGCQRAPEDGAASQIFEGARGDAALAEFVVPLLGDANYCSASYVCADDDVASDTGGTVGGWLLAAAHCMDQSRTFKVHMGADPRVFNPANVPSAFANEVCTITALHRHDAYEGSRVPARGEATEAFADILLARFECPAHAMKKKRCALVGRQDAAPGTQVHVAGYGMSRGDGFEGRLNVTRSPLEVERVVKEPVGPGQRLELKRTGDSTFCQGDSGGPGFVGAGPALRVVAVTSSDAFDCKTGKAWDAAKGERIYMASVASFQPFLQRYLGEGLGQRSPRPFFGGSAAPSSRVEATSSQDTKPSVEPPSTSQPSASQPSATSPESEPRCNGPRTRLGTLSGC